MAKTTGDEAWKDKTLSVPAGAFVAVFVALCGVATVWAQRPQAVAADSVPATRAEVQILHDDVVKLTASVDQLTKTMAEVKAIEDRFHPRGEKPRDDP